MLTCGKYLTFGFQFLARKFELVGFLVGRQLINLSFSSVEIELRRWLLSKEICQFEKFCVHFLKGTSGAAKSIKISEIFGDVNGISPYIHYKVSGFPFRSGVVERRFAKVILRSVIPYFG